MTAACSTISIIIPALNEETYIGRTLQSIHAAADYLKRGDRLDPEIIVVDNGSTDRTAEIASSLGARVIEEPQGNVAIARNAGARAATGQVLVFVDADVLWPKTVLFEIEAAMSDEQCIGGAIDTDYQPQRWIIRTYLQVWRVVGRLLRMAQGATQFYRADVFASLGGYDATMFMGEDVDLYWRLQKTARATGSRVNLIDNIRVVPSCRRFDQWPVWKTILLTNPVMCAFFARRKKPWRDWYDHPPR